MSSISSISGADRSVLLTVQLVKMSHKPVAGLGCATIVRCNVTTKSILPKLQSLREFELIEKTSHMLGVEEKYLPDEWKNGKKWRMYWRITRFLSIVTLVGVFHIALAVLPGLVVRLDPLETSDRIALTGIWATIILTFALIAVYRDIGELQEEQVEELREQRNLQEDLGGIQRKQAEIMETQQEIMVKQHEPILEILGEASYGGFVAFKIRNIGRGPATNFHLAIHTYVLELDMRLSTGPDPLSHVEGLDPLEPITHMESFSAAELSEISSLTPDQTGILAAEVYTHGPNVSVHIGPNRKGRGIKELSQLLHDEGGHDVYYQVEINFDHQMETCGKGRHFLPTKVRHVDTEMSISAFLDPDETHDVNPRQSSHFGFKSPGTYFDE